MRILQAEKETYLGYSSVQAAHKGPDDAPERKRDLHWPIRSSLGLQYKVSLYNFVLMLI